MGYGGSWAYDRPVAQIKPLTEEEKKQKREEEKHKAEEERQRVEAELKADEERKKAEEEKKWAEKRAQEELGRAVREAWEQRGTSKVSQNDIGSECFDLLFFFSQKVLSTCGIRWKERSH